LKEKVKREGTTLLVHTKKYSATPRWLNRGVPGQRPGEGNGEREQKNWGKKKRNEKVTYLGNPFKTPFKHKIAPLPRGSGERGHEEKKTGERSTPGGAQKLTLRGNLAEKKETG